MYQLSASDQRSQEHVVATSDMEQGDRNYRTILSFPTLIAFEGSSQHAHHHLVDHSTMGKYHSFGVPRGATGVHDQCRVISGRLRTQRGHLTLTFCNNVIEG
jgi:hypothetical protein